MSEVKCYGFHIGTDETITRRFEVMADLKALQNDKKSTYVGITPTVYGQCLLFRDREKRNEYLMKFRGKYQSIHKEKREIFVDEKYLASDYKPTVEEFAQGDSVFVDFMNEFREDVKKELKKELSEECDRLKAENQKLKAERNEAIAERNKYQTMADYRQEVIEAERKLHSEQIEKLNKKILALESDLVRMEKQNMFGSIGKEKKNGKSE